MGCGDFHIDNYQDQAQLLPKIGPVMNDSKKILHQAEVFRKLPKHECDQLIDSAIQKKLDSGQFLVHQDDVWPYVLYVNQGQLQWSILSAGGKEHLLFSLDDGEVFWAHSIFDDLPMPGFLMAVKPTQVYLWDRQMILRVLKRYPDAMWDVTKLLSGIMRKARTIIYGLAFQPVAGRLASMLVNRCMDQSGTSIERNFTLNEVASTVASTPEAVCRLLYQFQEEGILEITRASINVSNMDSLKNIADGN
jgi:CRP-like cAMP-binding protein